MKAQYIRIDENGNKFYYSDREMVTRHREDGPAAEYSNGFKSWFINGSLHREDGPAVEWADGSKMCCNAKMWCLNGQRITKAEHARRTAKETVLTLDEIAAKFGIDVSKLKIAK